MTTRSSRTALAALCAASMLAACSGSDASVDAKEAEKTASVALQTDSPTLAGALGIDDLPSITNNTFDQSEEAQITKVAQPTPQPAQSALPPLPEGATYHSQDASHLDALFASALEFKSENLETVWLAAEPTLLDDRSYVETLACNRDINGFTRMAGNEFEYHDFITTKQTQFKDQIASFTAKLPEDENGKYALFWVVVTETLGDYDFENEAFAFDPFPYDYLREGINIVSNCAVSGYWDGKINVAPFFPDQARLWLSFGPGITSLPLPKDDARAYLQSVSDYGEPIRDAEIDMLIKVPLSFEDIPNRTAETGYQGQPATRMVKLVQKPTKVVAVRVKVGGRAQFLTDDSDRSILGEYMPAYFGAELAD